MQAPEKGVFNFFYFVFNYGRYHNNTVNQLLHVVFVPTIQFTLFIILNHYGHHVSLPFLEPVIAGGSVCLESWIFALLVQFSYYRVDTLVAMVYTAWALPQAIIAQNLSNNSAAHTHELFGEQRSLLWLATSLHIVSWISQFYGHGVHEGRAPALLDNLGFALLAPFFVTFETMNYLTGYREGKEMDEVRVAIKKDIADFQASKKNKSK